MYHVNQNGVLDRLHIFIAFTPEFLKWTSIYEIGYVHYLSMGCLVDINRKQNGKQSSDKVAKGKQCRYETLVREVSSGSALFAKVSVLVCRDERVKGSELS